MAGLVSRDADGTAPVKKRSKLAELIIEAYESGDGLRACIFLGTQV